MPCAGAQDYLSSPSSTRRCCDRSVTLRDRAQALRGPARPPGAPRPAHRAAQPGAVPRPPRGRARPLAPHERVGRSAVPRRRQLQASQRLARARGRRPGAGGARRAAAGDAAPDGHGRAVRRRRVHVPVRGAGVRARGRADRRADQPRLESADPARRRRALGHGQHRDRDGRRPDDPAGDGDPRGRRGDVPGQGARALALRAVRRGLARSARSARLELEAALRLAVERSTAARPLPAEGLAQRHSPTGCGSRRSSAGSTRSAACSVPREFLPLAEETGLVLPIGEFVLEQALRQLARWRASNPALTTVDQPLVAPARGPGLADAAERAIGASDATPARSASRSKRP